MKSNKKTVKRKTSNQTGVKKTKTHNFVQLQRLENIKERANFLGKQKLPKLTQKR